MERVNLFLAVLGLLVLLAACAPQVEEVVEDVALPKTNTFGPTFYCGYRKGSSLPHQVFVPKSLGAAVSLTLIGGESAAIGVEEGYFLAKDPAVQTLVLHYPGSLKGCLVPPLSASFEPGGAFGLVHVFGGEQKRIYSIDALNESPRGMRAFEALTPLGEKAGILIFIEEWVDADFNDAVLLLQGAEPLR